MAKAVLSPAPVSSPPVTRGLGKAATRSTLLKHTGEKHHSAHSIRRTLLIEGWTLLVKLNTELCILNSKQCGALQVLHIAHCFRGVYLIIFFVL